MFAVMQEFFRVGYTRGIYPEHPRFFTIDAVFPGYVAGRGYPGGGGNNCAQAGLGIADLGKRDQTEIRAWLAKSGILIPLTLSFCFCGD